MSEPVVMVERRLDVALVTLNRPSARNAINADLGARPYHNLRRPLWPIDTGVPAP